MRRSFTPAQAQTDHPRRERSDDGDCLGWHWIPCSSAGHRYVCAPERLVEPKRKKKNRESDGSKSETADRRREHARTLLQNQDLDLCHYSSVLLQLQDERTTRKKAFAEAHTLDENTSYLLRVFLFFIS